MGLQAEAQVLVLEGELEELEEQSRSMKEEIEYGEMALQTTTDPGARLVLAEQVDLTRRMKVETDANWSLKERELQILKQLIELTSASG